MVMCMYNFLLQLASYEDVEIMFLGNKCDLEEERMVTKEKGQKLAASCRRKFYETSAKTGVNVKEAFFTLARDIMDKLDPPVRMGG